MQLHINSNQIIAQIHCKYKYILEGFCLVLLQLAAIKCNDKYKKGDVLFCFSFFDHNSRLLYPITPIKSNQEIKAASHPHSYEGREFECMHTYYSACIPSSHKVKDPLLRELFHSEWRRLSMSSKIINTITNRPAHRPS